MIEIAHREIKIIVRLFVINMRRIIIIVLTILFLLYPVFWR